MAAKDRITVSVEHRDGIAVIVVGGEIDMNTAPALEAAVADVLAEEPAALIVQLSAVDFMGSAGLRILVAAQQQIGAGARVAVVANGPATRRPIQLTGLDETLSLYPTLDEAVTAVRPAAE
ncbi:MAG: STAS domain-containing protein [Mycobacterium sp.]